jgi:hypothetical protein
MDLDFFFNNERIVKGNPYAGYLFNLYGTDKAARIGIGSFEMVKQLLVQCERLSK